jgi:hypothetical protein
MGLRDRIATRRFGEALVSPSAIVSSGAGAALAVLVGLGPVGVVLGGAAFFGGRMAFALRGSGPPKVRIDPFQLDDPWRRLSQDALAARAQFADAVRSAPDGPLRDRLAEIGTQISDNVEECWKVARAGHQLSAARARLDAVGARAELDSLGPLKGATPSVIATAEALQSQLDTAHRLETTIDQTRDRLRLLNARLDDAVSRSIELSVSSATDTQIAEVGNDVAAITQEMEALRQALEIADGTMPIVTGEGPATATGSPA